MTFIILAVLFWFLIVPLLMGGGGAEVMEGFVSMLFVIALAIGWLVWG